MTNTELIDLLAELTALPAETEWVEFKQNNALLQEIGEYLSAKKIAKYVPYWC